MLMRRLQLKTTKSIRRLLPFKHLDRDEFEALVDELKMARFEDGEPICIEGEEGLDFHIVVDGEVTVWKWSEDEQRDVEIVTLGVGATFGEMALLRIDGKRTASVIAKGPVRTFKLARRKFRALLSSRSLQVIEYELNKFDKENKRKTTKFREDPSGLNEDQDGIRMSDQDKELAKLADLRKQLVDARREAERKENELKRLAEIDDNERKRIMSHPMYNESFAVVDSALKYAINRRSQRAAFRSGAAHIRDFNERRSTQDLDSFA